MNAFPLRLPRTTRAQADVMAHREGISVNEFILSAVAEKIANLTSLAKDTPRQKPTRTEVPNPAVRNKPA